MEETDGYHGFWEDDHERLILEDKIDKAIKKNYFDIYDKEIPIASFNIFQDITLAKCGMDWIFYGGDISEAACNKIIKSPFSEKDFHKLNYFLMINGFSEAADARCFEKSMHESKIKKLFNNYVLSIDDKNTAERVEDDLLDLDKSINLVDTLSEYLHNQIDINFDLMSEEVFNSFERDIAVNYEVTTGRIYENMGPLLLKADMILSGMDRQTMEGPFAYRIMGYLYMSEMEVENNILKMKCNSEEDAYNTADLINAYLLSRIAICSKKDVSKYAHQLEKRLDLMSLIYPEQKNIFKEFKEGLPDAVYFLREGYYSLMEKDINEEVHSGNFLKDLLSSSVNKNYEHMEETLLNFSRQGGKKIIMTAPGGYFDMMKSCMEETLKKMLDKIEKKISGDNVLVDFSLEECISIARDNEIMTDKNIKEKIKKIKKIYGKKELNFAKDMMPGSYKKAKGDLFLHGKLGPAYRNLRKGNISTAQDLLDNVWYALYFRVENPKLGNVAYNIQKRIEKKTLGNMIKVQTRYLKNREKEKYDKIRSMAFEFNLENFIIPSEQLEKIFENLENRYSSAQR